MPQIAAAAIISALGATGIAAAAITVATNVAFALAANAILGTMAPQTAAAEGRATDWTADPDAPIPFVFGRRGVAGTIVHRAAFGPENRYQGLVTVYSGGGPIQAFGDFLVDGSAVSFSGELMTTGTPANRLWRQTRLGAQPDTALTSPAVGYALADWTSAHKFSGHAGAMITLNQDGDFANWPNGEPRTLQVVQGVKAWDPRLDGTWPGGVGSCRLNNPATWVYTANPIIGALKWALGIRHNGVLVGGIGASVDGIDVTSLIEAANVADTNGWTMSAYVLSDAPKGDDKQQVFEAMLQAGGAVPARKQGKISCISRAAAPSSLVTITRADLAGPFEFVPGSRRERRKNTLIPRCVQEDQAWEMVDLGAVSSATYVTEDGGATRSDGYTLAYVDDADQAAQLTAYAIAHSREWEEFSLPLKPYLRDLEPGDAFTINDADLGITGQLFLCTGRAYNTDTDAVEISCTTETSAKHAWALGLTATAPASPTLGGVDPGSTPTPDVADWTLAAGTGTAPTLVLTGGAPTTVNVSKIIVEFKATAAATWTLLGEYPASSPEIEWAVGLVDTPYQVRLRYRNTFGAPGSPLTLTAVTTPLIDGGGVAPNTVDTPQFAPRAAHSISSVFADSTLTQATQALTANFGNLLHSLAVTTTGEPVEVEVFINDEVLSNGPYWYYLHIDSTFNVNGSGVETNNYDELPMRFGATISPSAINSRSFKWMVSGLAAGSHTFRVYLRNCSGNTITIRNRYLSVVEMKKGT